MIVGSLTAPQKAHWTAVSSGTSSNGAPQPPHFSTFMPPDPTSERRGEPVALTVEIRGRIVH
jgi:hypothetical protein